MGPAAHAAKSDFLAKIGKSDSGSVKISSAKDLYTKISANPKGKFVLTKDIDLSAYNNGVWVPLCGDYSKAFSGILDGQGYSIKNLRVTQRGSSSSAGLFQYINNGTVKNLGIDNVNIAAGGSAGGIAATCSGDALIYNCYVKSSYIYGKHAGGVFGVVSGDNPVLRYVNIKSDVAGSNYVGGLIGLAATDGYIRIENSKITGNISAYNTEKTSYGSTEAGGVIGTTSDLTKIKLAAISVKGDISACSLYSQLSSGSIPSYSGPSAYAGGLIGRDQHDYGSDHYTYYNEIILSDCTVQGNVTANAKPAAYAGGLIASTFGLNEKKEVITITNCQYNGQVLAEGNRAVSGGIVGSDYSSMSITSSRAKGSVLAKAINFDAIAGGAVASSSYVVLSDTMTTNNVNATGKSGKTCVGGIFGEITKANIKSTCYYTTSPAIGKRGTNGKITGEQFLKKYSK